MRTKAELAALEEANGNHSSSESASSFLTEAQRAALDAALAAKQTSPGLDNPIFPLHLVICHLILVRTLHTTDGAEHFLLGTFTLNCCGDNN